MSDGNRPAVTSQTGNRANSEVGKEPRLLDRVRTKLRMLHGSIRTEEAYCQWIVRFIKFHDLKHPDQMREREIEAFLSDLAVERSVSASTQNQALAAILFLYRHILEIDLERIDALRARRPERLPVVLSTGEVRSILNGLDGIDRLQAELLYGSGLRILECCRLRVKDVDFDRRALLVRDGKGEKDRAVPLPGKLVEPLTGQIGRVRVMHAQDVQNGHGRVWLPYAFAAKSPGAATELGWQYLFPSSRLSEDPRGDEIPDALPSPQIPLPKMRHHRSESLLQKRVKAAVRAAGITKRVSCHTFRHSFATHLLENGADIRLFGFSARSELRIAANKAGIAGACGCEHWFRSQLISKASPVARMIDTHLTVKGSLGVVSPLDRL